MANDQYDMIIAGVDEVGRGPLAGPVVAAACVLPDPCSIVGIKDSKQLKEHERLVLYRQLIEHPLVDVGVGIVEPFEIDRLNIHHASLEAMKRAVDQLKKRPTFLLVDGKFVPKIDIEAKSIVKGDQKEMCIAAASILAKVTRDQIMVGYGALYPEYHFPSHKGYATKKHKEAIKQLGTLPIHRKTFL